MNLYQQGRKKKEEGEKEEGREGRVMEGEKRGRGGGKVSVRCPL